MDVDSRGGIYKRKATAAEDAAMSAALEEIRAGEYVTHDAISWE